MKLIFAMTGSFCTLDRAMEALAQAVEACDEVLPVFSETAAFTDTRFGLGEEFLRRAETLCGRAAIVSVAGAEPLGPRGMADAMLLCPCTGNTLAKLAHGINDTAVTMAAKSLLRNGKPVVLAPFTNDGLAAAAANIGLLLNRRDVYFVPFRQDDPEKKPRSLASELGLCLPAVRAALEGRQLQPILAGQ